METKKCNKCNTIKPITDFYNKYIICKTCRKEYIKTLPSYQNYKKQAYLKRYGMIEDDYKELEEFQGGVCAICGNIQNQLNIKGKPKRLCVDHNHSTGAIRGLLCGRCNLLLGRINDNAELLRRAADYLDAEDI